MPLAVNFSSHLDTALVISSTELVLDPAQATLVKAALDEPSHIFLNIYTISQSEVVLVYGYTERYGVTYFKITRGQDGTTAKEFKVGTCISLVRQIPGAACGSETSTTGDDCECGIDGKIVGSGCVTVTVDDGVATIGLMPTGLSAGTYGGLTIDGCGRVSAIEANWPASQIPIIDLCGCDCSGGGTGGTVTAADVTFSPQLGDIITANQVQLALQQLDTYVQANTGGVYVSSVTAGTGISVAGTVNNPIVSVTPSGISSGVYAGFSVNALGQVTGYTPPATSGTVDALVEGASIDITLSGLNTYTIAAVQATDVTYGTVRVEDNSKFASSTEDNTKIADIQGVKYLIDRITDPIESDIIAAQADISSLNAQVSTFNTNLTAVQADVTTLDGTVTTIQTDLNTAETDIDTIETALGAPVSATIVETGPFPANWFGATSVTPYSLTPPTAAQNWAFQGFRRDSTTHEFYLRWAEMFA